MAEISNTTIPIRPAVNFAPAIETLASDEMTTPNNARNAGKGLERVGDVKG
jgi:hypothetical protein